MGELIRCSPPAAPGVEAKFPDARVAGSQWRRDGGSTRPLPTFGAAAARLECEPSALIFLANSWAAVCLSSACTPGKGACVLVYRRGKFQEKGKSFLCARSPRSCL